MIKYKDILVKEEVCMGCGSYKYVDFDIRNISGNYHLADTIGSYVDELTDYISKTSDHIYKSEDDGKDLSKLSDDIIWKS